MSIANHYGQERPGSAGGERTAELAFGDVGDHLPWLESDDDEEERGVDAARIVIFAVIGLVAVGLIAGILWWMAQSRGSASLIPEGGTIEAPEGPYKTKPEEPGGKTFEGTGDTSFAVAEGQAREGRIAATPPQPRIDLNAAEAASSLEPAPASSASSGVGVQVGAYSDRASAERGWQTLLRQFEALQGVSHRVVEGRADIGRVFRLQAIAPDLAAARDLCDTLRADGGACQVKP